MNHAKIAGWVKIDLMEGRIPRGRTHSGRPIALWNAPGLMASIRPRMATAVPIARTTRAAARKADRSTGNPCGDVEDDDRLHHQHQRRRPDRDRHLVDEAPDEPRGHEGNHAALAQDRPAPALPRSIAEERDRGQGRDRELVRSLDVVADIEGHGVVAENEDDESEETAHRPDDEGNREDCRDGDRLRKARERVLQPGGQYRHDQGGGERDHKDPLDRGGGSRDRTAGRGVDFDHRDRWSGLNTACGDAVRALSTAAGQSSMAAGGRPEA